MKSLLAAAGRLAIFLVTFVAVLGLGDWILLRPGPRRENERLEATLSHLQNKINEGRAAQRALPLYREELKRLEEEAERLLSAAPAGAGPSELPTQLRRISAASGVELATPASEEDVPESAARVRVRGTRRQVLAFFAALRDDPYPFVADDLELVPVEDTADFLQADLVVASPLEEATGGP